MEVSDVDSEDRLGTPRANPGNLFYWVALIALLGASTLIISVALRVTSYWLPGFVSPEGADRAIWLSACCLVAMGVLASVTPRMRIRVGKVRGSTVLGLTALGILTIGIAWTEYVSDLPSDIQEGWWLGFGPTVALGTALLIPVLIFIGRPTFTLLTRYLAFLGIIIATVWYLPVLLNPPWSFDAHHANPVLNDVLGPFVGKFPLADQITQYTSLLGYPLVPVLALAESTLGSKSVILVSSAYLSTLAVITVSLFVWTAFRILPARIARLAPLLVLPIMLASGDQGGSIGQSFSALPSRLLFPILILTALTAWWPLDSWWKQLTLGALSGAAIVNNPEFGVVAVIALVAAITLTLGRRCWRVLGLVITGSFIFAGSYIVMITAVSTGLDLNYFASYARAFGQGSLSLAMPSTGTFLLILTLPGAAIIYASYWLRSSKEPQVVLPGLVAIFAGVMTLGSFAYYVGRSSSSGQLQALLPFFSLALVATIAMIGLPHTRQGVTNPTLIAGLLAASLPAFALAGLLQAPDPRAQWGKVVPDASTSFLLAGQSDVLEVNDAIARVRDTQPGTRIAVALDNGNLYTALLEVTNVSPINYLSDRNLSKSLSAALCDSLQSADEVILIPNEVAEPILRDCSGLTYQSQVNSTFVVVTATG